MEDLDPVGERISNQAPEGETSTLLVIKWLEKVEGFGDNIYIHSCAAYYTRKRRIT